MKTVHKYVLNITDVNKEMLLKGSNIIKTGVQRNKICIWYEVETDEVEFKERIFYVVGTGHKLPEFGLKLLNTVLIENDNLVFHIYEKK